MGLATESTRQKNDVQIEFHKIVIWKIRVQRYFVISGMNRVAVAQNGLKLWGNRADGFRKTVAWFPDLWEAIKKSLKTEKSQHT